MKFFSIYSLGVATAVLLSACTHHEQSFENECIQPNSTSDVNISLNVDTHLFEHATVTRADNTPLRYAIAVYNADMSAVVASARGLSPNFNVELPVGKYHLLSWADYAVDGLDADHHFFTDNLSGISLADELNYVGNRSDKMAFSSMEDFTVAYRKLNINSTLKPHMAQFRIYATDTPDYEVGKVVVSYLSTVPSLYNPLTGSVSSHWSNVSFSGEPQSDCVCFDNLFSITEESPVKIKVEIFDKSDKLIARRESIDFPVVRGGITKVNAQIYSAKVAGTDPEPPTGGDDEDKPSGGGIGIDEDFDETYTIVI